MIRMTGRRADHSTHVFSTVSYSLARMCISMSQSRCPLLRYLLRVEHVNGMREAEIRAQPQSEFG